MPANPILDELYAAREQLLADAGGDVRRYLEGVRRREAASGRLATALPKTANGCVAIAEEHAAAVANPEPASSGR